MKKRILVVEDEARILEVVEYALTREGWDVASVGNGRDALERAKNTGFDAIVLDVMLPEMDGLEVVRRLRSSGTPAARTPVLFLSAKGEEVDRIVGLEIGGDDYLAKPFSPRELVARVRALLRRAEQSPAPAEDARRGPIAHGPISLDLDRHEARCNGALVELTATEFGMLVALFERPGVVLTRSQLMQRAYAYDNLITDRTIDTHVKRVRAKFRPFDVDPIFTVFGVGYKASGG
ncbi:MAG: response regulator transcription factor [Myxococcales bacterium]|nr:response regulator transcription factor [Myxococcales bacterium]